MLNHEISCDNRSKTLFTKHGAARSQQRSIPPAVIDGLIFFGEACHDKKGAVQYSFSKSTWRAYSAHLGTGSKHFERYRSVYVVIGENGSVITFAA